MQVDHNPYLAYKQDTRYLLQWIICTSNEVLRCLTAHERQQDHAEPNKTGEVTVKQLLAMAARIGARNLAVPSSIFSRLRAVIAARSLVAESYKTMLASSDSDRDEEVEEANASHAHFIEALTSVFTILGGEDWGKTVSASGAADQETKPDTLPVFNKFSNLNTCPATEHVSHNTSEDESIPEPVKSFKQRHLRKRNKTGSSGRKSKGSHAAVAENVAAKPEQPLPLEAYKLIDYDEKGEPTDFLLATIFLSNTFTQLRFKVANSWHNAMHNGINTAAVAAACHVATAMVRQCELAMFVDFSGSDNFQSVLETIRRDKRLEQPWRFMARKDKADDQQGEQAPHRQSCRQKEPVDVREQFMMPIYEHLVDFVVDYRHARSGKPSKRMAAQLKGWNAKLDLAAATAQERLVWRRCYTINWLYDLVKLVSSVVVQHHFGKAGKARSPPLNLDEVDWQATGPWFEKRKLFGLVEFGGRITSLAMQKPGAEIHKRIPPSLVFELQCLVDSYVATRGLVYHPSRGAIFRDPAPGFHPRRDIDLFLKSERETEKHRVEYILNFATRHMRGLDPVLDKFDSLLSSFGTWLGRCPFKHEEAGVPPARCDAGNGGSYSALWDLSPYLCGAGLLEALEIAHYHVLAFWDRDPFAPILVHLYNLLRKTGHIKPVAILETLMHGYLGENFFDGDTPSSRFIEAFDHLHKRRHNKVAKLKRERMLREARGHEDLMSYLDPGGNLIFNRRGLIGTMRRASWNPDRGCAAYCNPGDKPQSALGAILDLPDMVEIFMSDCCYYPPFHDDNDDDDDDDEADGDDAAAAAAAAAANNSGRAGLSMSDVAMLLKTPYDLPIVIIADQLSTYLAIDWSHLNYSMIYVLGRIMKDVHKWHRERSERLSMKKPGDHSKKRDPTLLVMLAMIGQDEEILKVFAESLEGNRGLLQNTMYWNMTDIKTLMHYWVADP